MVQVTREDANEILRQYLKDHGISQTWLAEKMGMSLSSFNARLQGYSKFDADFALKVAVVLNISPDIFLSKSYRKSVTRK